MNYGPSCPVYFPRDNKRPVGVERALETIGVEAIWITSKGTKVFQIDLSGIVDDEKRVNRYLRIKR